MSELDPDLKKGIAIAQEVLKEARQAMTDAYESGGLSGLCAEGRWELALDALHSLELEKIVLAALKRPL